jgi:drug/metabolite transporter (DMT)-like permease
MTAFILIGALIAIVGLAVLVAAIRHQSEQRPRYAAMLIGGMMATAFGVIIAGFALAYQRAAPLDLNQGAARP